MTHIPHPNSSSHGLCTQTLLGPGAVTDFDELATCKLCLESLRRVMLNPGYAVVPGYRSTEILFWYDMLTREHEL